MKDNRRGHHTLTRLTAHIVWSTKYRYHVLEGDIKVRCRELLMQICDAEDVRILSGVVSKDHVHMHISAEAGIGGFGQTLERTLVAAFASRISKAQRTLLGQPLLGNRLWCVEHGQHHR